jgi:iron(III) transport system substrate-binding protein
VKRILGLLLALAFVLSGCGKIEAPDPLDGWLEAANLDAEETAEELYAAALKEDTLVAYTTSKRMFDVAESFEANYPGLTVRVEHIREGAMIDKLRTNYETGDWGCDLLLTADGQGIMQNEFLPNNIIVKYVPHDMEEQILPGNNGDFLMLVGEASVFSYNENYYAAPPVQNWWELTEEKWRGMVYMPNPIQSTTTLAFLNMMIKESGLMAQAYEDFYGKPLELPEGETAGREFVRRLAMNDVHIVNSSDETAEAVGAPGLSGPYVGIIISSKTRLRDIGYEMVNHYGM